MGLRETFQEILNGYSEARGEDFTGHSLAAFIRGPARDEVQQAANGDYTFKGSAGLNDWAVTPWIAVLDPLVTDTTQRGFYVVYLFNAEDQAVYLSLNQGVTAVKEEFGSGQAQKDILEARAAVMRKRLGAKNKLPDDQIVLSEATQLSKSYQWGHVTGVRYDAANLPDEAVLVRDLKTALRAYETLIDRNGYVLEEESVDGSVTVEEKRRLRMHERIERVAADPRKIKRLKGFACEACGFDFQKTYGNLGHEFIEAHHLVPIGSLEAGKSRKVDLQKDFAVLCANCHRMIHRLDDPSDLEALRASMK